MGLAKEEEEATNSTFTFSEDQGKEESKQCQYGMVYNKEKLTPWNLLAISTEQYTP